MLKIFIQNFIKENGRPPNPIELLQLKFKASGQIEKGNITKIPTKYKKPPSPKKEEGIPFFEDNIQQQGFKFFRDLANKKLPPEQRVYGPFGKGTDGASNMMLWMMQNTPEKTMEVMKQYGYKPKLVPKPKQNISETEAAEEVGLGSLRESFTKKYPPHKVSDELGFRRKEYPAGVEPGSIAAKAIDEADAIQESKLKRRMERENKEAAERIRRKQKETMDDMKEIEDPEDMASGGRAGFYFGGDVKPDMSDIGHGSDSLMARTRLVSPNSMATTSTGLNYLLAEDNDNIRIPYTKGGLAKILGE